MKEKLNIDTPIAPVDLTTSIIHRKEKSFFERARDRFFNLTSKENLILGLKYVAFIIPLFVAFYLANKVYEKQSLNSMAGGGQASLLFQVSNLSLPPDSDLTVIANPSGPVGFAKVELSFDPSVVKLVTEIDVSTSPLKKIVKISSMAEANSTGKIIVVLGLDPSSVSNPPSGSFQFAKFKISKNTSNNNVSSSILFNIANSQIVNLDQTLFALSSTNLSILVNPVATSTPSPTAQATVSPIPTATSVGKNCSACQRRKCDNVCNPKRDGAGCPDCI